MDIQFTKRGFLPQADPLTHFAYDSELSILDEIGNDLPSLLEDRHFRQYAKELQIPELPQSMTPDTHQEELRLYYVRLGFLASGYVNQLGQEPATVLPKNIAVPLAHIAKTLNRPPILSYDGYALFNWKRFDKSGPIALGNIDTFQNFVHMYDEHWFILVHVEIEALAAEMFSAIHQMQQHGGDLTSEQVDQSLNKITESMAKQVAVLKRIPEKMDPELYYKTFRPYIRFFENVVYEGVNQMPIDFRGETGAQSSIMPTLVTLLKIPHQPSALTNHLEDMRNYMPEEHRAMIEEVKAMPDLRELAGKDSFNHLLETMAEFREIHLKWAVEYIQKWETDPRGTGGTPYLKWLKQLIDETRDYKK